MLRRTPIPLLALLLGCPQPPEDEIPAIYGKFNDVFGDALEGAEVCWETTDDRTCVATSSYGAFSLDEVPAQPASGQVTVDHARVVPLAIPVVLRTTGSIYIFVEIDTPSVLADLQSDAGVTPTPGHGAVVLQSYAGFQDPRDGTTSALDPPSGFGPFYLDHTAVHLDLEAQSAEHWGVSVFLDVDPALGPFRAEVLDGDVPCEAPYLGSALPDIDVLPDGEVYLPVVCP